MRRRVDVGDDDALRRTELDLVDGLAEPISGRRHERCVERSRHGQRHELLRAELFGDSTGLGYGVGVAGDDHLAGSVVVRDPDVAGDAGARLFDFFVVEAEYGGHGAGALFGRDLHGFAAFGDQAHGVGEIECPRCGESAVLAEAVAGMSRRLAADPTDRVEHHHAQHERGELGIARLLELVGIGLQ